MWWSAVFAEIPSAAATCLVCSPRASSATTSTSRSVRPAGRSMSRRLAGPLASSTAATASASNGAAAALRAQPLGGLGRRQRRPVRPRLGHRVEGVGGGEQPRRRRQLGGGRSAVVAGAVQTLVVGAGQRRQRRQQRGAHQHALGVIGVQADLLPLVGSQRPGLLPDARMDRDAPEVVHAARAADRRDLVVAHPQRRAAAGSERRDAGRVTGQVRRGEVGEVTHRPQSTVDLPPPPASTAAPARQPSVCSHADASRSSARMLARVRPPGSVAISGSNACPARRAHHGGHLAGLAQHALDSGIARHVDDAQRQRDPLAPGPPEQTLAVPALGQVREQAVTDAGRPTRSASISATSQAAVMCGRSLRTALGARRATSSTRTRRARLPEAAARA